MSKSKCCNVKARVDEADEGTCCYMCSQCGKPCDVRPSVSSKRDEMAEALTIKFWGDRERESTGTDRLMWDQEVKFARMVMDAGRAETIEEVLEILKIYSHDLDIAIEVEHITDKIKCLKGAK